MNSKKQAVRRPQRVAVGKSSLRLASGKIDDGLQSAFTDAIGSAKTLDEVQASILVAISELVPGVTGVVATRQADGVPMVDPSDSFVGSLPTGAGAIIQSMASRTGQLGRVQTSTLSGTPTWNLVAAPTIHRGRAPDVLVVAAESNVASVDRLSTIAQLAASHITMWGLLKESQSSRVQQRHTIAVADLVMRLADVSGQSTACQVIASELKRYLNMDQVAIGLCTPGSDTCRWVADADVSQVNRHGDAGQKIEAVFRESLHRDQVTRIDRHGARLANVPTEGKVKASVGEESPNAELAAHDDFADSLEHAVLWTVPLRDESGRLSGSIVLGRQTVPSDLESVEVMLGCLPQRLGVALQAATQRKRGWLRRGVARSRSRGLVAKLTMASLLICGAAAVLATPMPYRVTCDCVLEPSMRRFVSAPYAGRLEESDVRPGDVVRSGQTLARMDRRELEWELAGLQADYRSTQKDREAAAARDEVAKAQLSELEMRRLRLKTQLTQHRLDNLEIKSPVDGVVLTGDYSRSEGAPLTVGQALYEVAPLDRMIVEVAIPESDIQFVKAGMPVQFRLNSDPGTDREGKLVRVHPRSELRDRESVFVAEVEILNEDGTLRPGMKGVAQVVADSRPIVWNLAHKTWDSIAMKLGL